jgi:D-threo-aldose 1-dehydrogenase
MGTEQDAEGRTAVKPLATRQLGRTDLSVTELGFGGAPLGNLFTPIPEAAALRAVQVAFDAGIRYFDTAPLYGHGLSERRLGAALGTYFRPTVVLSSKVGRLLEPGEPAAGAYVDVPPYRVVFDYSYDGTLRSVDASLTRLGLDRIDILLIHDIDAFTHGPDRQPTRYREAMTGAYPALTRLRREGTVRAIGLGVNEWQVCQRSLEEADFDCFLLAGRYSLLDQGALAAFLPRCAERGVGVIIGGPFNSGVLVRREMTGATYDYRPAPPEIWARTQALDRVCRAHAVPLAAAALQFPLMHPAVASVIPGMRSAEEVEANLAFLRHPIPGPLWQDLKAEGLLAPDAPTSAG